jgi:hypothetical protein
VIVIMAIYLDSRQSDVGNKELKCAKKTKKAAELSPGSFF